MNSLNDIFEFSEDEEMVALKSPVKLNPVETNLMKQLEDVKIRIAKEKNEIKEIEDTTMRVLKALHSKEKFGEVITSDSDSDYTIEGIPVLKKAKKEMHNRNQILTVLNSWKHIVHDKWVIGVRLKNTSTEELCKLRFYVEVKDENEMQGTSMFWHPIDDTFWNKIEIIGSRSEVTATAVLDLPKFERESSSLAYGTISYEFEGKQYQTPVSIIRLLAEESIDDSCSLKFPLELDSSLLALKSTSIERIVLVKLEAGTRFLKFLEEHSFEEIVADIYVVRTNTLLMYSLVEITEVVVGERTRDVTLKISSRSVAQMNVILRVLQDQFPAMTVKEANNCVEAATALIGELKSYLNDESTSERQRARIKSDLFIP